MVSKTKFWKHSRQKWLWAFDTRIERDPEAGILKISQSLSVENLLLRDHGMGKLPGC